VRRIMLPDRPDQKVRVEMNLKSSTRQVIKKDSVAAIRTEGLVCDQYVEITFGSPGAPGVNNADSIGTEPPLEISDMMKKTNAILDSLQGAVQNVNQATGNLDAISSKVNEGKGSLGGLINDRSVYQHVNQAATNLQEDTEALKHNFLTRGFFKQRGYEDETELKKNAIGQLPAEAPDRRFALPGSKLFDKPDSAKLKNGKMLDEAGRFLQQNSYGLAAVVRDYLAEHFKVDDKRIKTIGMGKSANAPDGGSVEVLVDPEGKQAG
jgi:MlaD protein